MSTKVLAVRVDPRNCDHHLWNNHGTWWVHYTLHPTRWTKRRVRTSLGTGDIAEARRRRDELFRILEIKRHPEVDAPLLACG